MPRWTAGCGAEERDLRAPMSTTPTRRLADRYELVFVLLLLTFVLGAFADEGWARVPILGIYAVALMIALRSAQLTGRVARTVRALLAVGTLVTAVAVLAAPSDGTQAAIACWLALVLATTIVVILGRVLRHRTVTLQTVFGALSVYLLIGFFFTAVYTAVAHLVPGPFFAGGKPLTAATSQYFSFVTLSTTGYGDYTSQGNGGRSLAVLESLFGQIFLVTLVARLVAMFGMVRPLPPTPRKNGRGAAEAVDEDVPHEP
jgi:hypothetical protein